MNQRYSRQMLFSGIGKQGQEKLLTSKVLLVGCGALGASHAEMLARAGVGKLRIVDRDFVEFTNLQRQTLYSEADAEQRERGGLGHWRRRASGSYPVERTVHRLLPEDIGPGVQGSRSAPDVK